jgi:hypothetical protein
MIREKQDGEDLVFVAVDRTNAAAGEREVLRLNGNTGSVKQASTAWAECWDKSAVDGSASAATAEHTIFRAASDMTLNAVRYVPDAALTADNTNYATITVKRRNADGTGAVTLASVTTQITGSGNWSQWVAVNIPVVNASVSAGQIVTVGIAKAGTGVAVPAGQLVSEYKS